MTRFAGFLAGHKKFMRRLVVIALPIIFQDFINSAVNFLDFLMIGRLGLNAINGVSLSNQIFFLFSLVGFGLTSGSSILMGQFWGKRDTRNIHRVMGICFVAGFAAAAAFAAAALAAPETIIGFYSNEPAVIAEGAKYLRIVCLSYIISSVTICLNAACRATGYTRVPMMSTLIALAANGAFNMVFIFGLGLGVKGAAIATIISRICELAAIISFIRFLRIPAGTRIKRYFTGNMKLLKQFFKIALPVVANESVWALGTTLYAVAYKYCGNEAQGAVQISGQVFNLFWVVGMGFSAGCGVILANLLGAGEIEKAVEYSRRALFTGVSAAVVMCLFMFGFAPLFVRLFNVQDSVRQTAVILMRISAVGLILKTWNYTTIVSILRSGGDTMFCLMVDGGAVWMCGMPLGFLAAAVLGLPVYFVMIAVYMEEVLKLFLSGWRVFSNKWARSIV
jgi:putative MATE family efflux protein